MAVTLVPACAEEVSFGSENVEIIIASPTLGQENTPLDSKIIRDFMQNTDLHYAVYPVPVARAATVIADLPACSSPASRKFADQNNFVWIGPIMDSHPSVFVRDGLERPVTRLEDLAGFRVGSLKGNGASMSLLRAGVDPDPVQSERLNLNKLRAGRLDYWVTREEYARHVASLENVAVPKKVLALPVEPLGLSCNRAIAAPIIDRLRDRANIYYRLKKMPG